MAMSKLESFSILTTVLLVEIIVKLFFVLLLLLLVIGGALRCFLTVLVHVAEYR